MELFWGVAVKKPHLWGAECALSGVDTGLAGPCRGPGGGPGGALGLCGALGVAGPWGWGGPCPGGGAWEAGGSGPRQRVLGSWSGAPARRKIEDKCILTP